MRMIDRIKQAMRDTGVCDGMSDEDLDIAVTAALEAMREPSDTMIKAFDRDVSDWFNHEIEDENHLYKTMIDAALNE